MADTFDYDKMAEAFTKAFTGGGGGKPVSLDPKSVEEFKKQIKESTDLMKKSLPASKQAEQLFRGQRAATIDITKDLEALDKQIEDLSKNAKNSNDNEAVFQLQRQRNNKEQAAGVMNVKIAMQNFGVGIGEVASTMLKGAFQYAKDLQSGASGVEAGNAAAATAARAAGDTVSVFGQGLSAAGPLIGQFAKRLPWLGSAITAVGVGLDIFGKKAADIGEAGLKFLGDELKKTTTGFKDITSSGAVFAGGMTEMRNVAAGAGLDISQLATVVKSSKGDLTLMGMGLGEATKRLGGVSKELRTSELGIQLRKLGYSAEEQAELAAGLMANQRASGSSRVMSDMEVAKQTASYGKDLKILADITGQDAKQAAEKARTQAMQADILAKLGPEESERFQAQMRAMPEALQKGFMQQLSGGVITDVATNVLMSQQPAIAKVINQGIANIRDSSKSASQVQQEALEARGRLGEQERERLKAGGDVINMVARLSPGASAAVGATADMTNSLILQTQANEEAAKKSKENADKAAQNTAPLDVAVAAIEENAQKLKAAMGAELTGTVTTFASTMAMASTTVGEALKKAGLGTTSTSEKVGGAVGGIAGGMGGAAAGALAGAALGSIVPVLGTAIGGIVGGLIGGAAGGWGGEKLGSAAGAAIHKFGDGGIVTGPTRAIIGEAGMNEAVIPLPNGKSVPLDLDMASIKQAFADIAGAAIKMGPVGAAVGAGINSIGSMTSSGSDTAQEQIALLREIREVLTGSKDLQQQFVQNTYA